MAGRSTPIAVDNVAAACEGAQRLLELGHRQLLVVVSSTAIGNIRERVAGIDAAIADVPGARAELIEAGNEVEAIAAGGDRPAGPPAAADGDLHAQQRADPRAR